MKGTVYTCIFGKYDYLKPIKVPQTGDFRYICYTDQPRNSEIFSLYDEYLAGFGWEIIQVPLMKCGQVKTARWYKINYHEHIEDDFSIYVDGTFFINTNLSHWIKRRYIEPFTCVKHPFDNCSYVDGFNCISGKRGNKWELMEQLSDYRKEGMPEYNGLIASGILMRNKSEVVSNFCRQWWEQVEKYSERDQVAWGYVNWKNPGVANFTQWDYTTQNEFEHCPHRHKINAEIRVRQMMKTVMTL